MRLIDADALLRDLNKKTIGFNADINKAIIDAPTVEPKRGRWIVKHSKQWSGGGGTFCSNCNTGYSFGAFLDVEDFNYCPNCGAKMGEE